MAISQINPVNTQKITFGKSIIADISQKHLGLDEKKSEQVDYYGKMAAGGGVAGLVTSFFSKGTVGKLKGAAIGLVATPAIFFGLSFAMEKIKETLKKDPAPKEQSPTDDAAKIIEKTAIDKPKD